MSILLIKEKNDTPLIELNNEKGEFSFSGKSFPEDAMAFYSPIKKWIKEYIKENPDSTEILFRLDYINTASTKMLMELLTYFIPIADQEGKKLIIKWYYKYEDEDMKLTGNKFKVLTNLPFELISY